MAEAGKLNVSYLIYFQPFYIQPALQNRLYLMGNIPSNKYWGNQLPRLINYGKHGRLNLRSVKLYADGTILLLKRSTVFLFGVPCSGALGSWGAALLAPYSDKPDSHGLMLNSPEILETLVRQFWKDGWQTVRCMVFLVEHWLI